MQNDIASQAPNAEEIMRNVDKESNTRVFTGWRKMVISILLIGFAAMILLFQLVIQVDNFVKYPVYTSAALSVPTTKYPKLLAIV